jgi:outer membrane murein-binding lipoprotein Lpp
MEQHLTHLLNAAASAPLPLAAHQASQKAAEAIVAYINELNAKIKDLEEEIKDLK